MPDAAPYNPSDPARRQSRTSSVLLPAILFFGAMIMAADFTAIDRIAFNALRIPYPKLLEYSPFIVPAACAMLWIFLRRRWPNGGPIVAVLLCFTVIGLIPRYAESQIARIPVTQWIELKSTEARLGFPITVRGSQEGNFVLVARPNEPAMRAELGRLGLLRPDRKN